MQHSLHPPPTPAPGSPTSLLRAFFTLEHDPLRDKAPGQGLVEYSLTLVLIAIVVIGALTMLGKQTSEVYVEVNCTLDGGKYRTDNGNGNSNRCVLPHGNGGGNGGGNGNGNGN